MTFYRGIIRIATFFVSVSLLMACATNAPLAEGQYEVKKVVVVSDNPDVDASSVRHYVHQLPGMREGKRKNLVYDSLQTRLSCADLTSALQSQGYLDATVDAAAELVDKKAKVTYTLHPRRPYHLRNVTYDIQDARLDSLLESTFSIHDRSVAHLYGSPLQKGKQFSVSALNEERNKLTEYLQNNGYYRFNKDFIRYHADSVPGRRLIDLTLQMVPYRESSRDVSHAHPHYNIRNITYSSPDSENLNIRNSVLRESTSIVEGKPYSATAVQDTYRRFGRMQAVKYTNVHFDEVGDSWLDCNIQVSTAKPNTISFQPEGTNTAGNLGAAVSLIYQNRNLFKGSELLSLQLRGAFEAITGLEGYQNHDYEEYGAEASLMFPRFVTPIGYNALRRNPTATSELSLAYNLQNRPEFHRRVFSAAWRYRWSVASRHTQWKLDLLDLNYIHMPWISETFKRDYLDSVSNRNAILRYNYEDLFIMKIGVGMTYIHGDNALKWNLETSGNILNGISSLAGLSKNSEGQYTVFSIAYAQYVKGDIDATHIWKLSPQSQFVVHGGLGIAYPYGNSKVLPFEKRYFSGGANSVRGWSVRGLGPGSFKGNDGRIDFINQTGDIKLDMNLEYRTYLFWKFSGAAFVDAGNIWTIRNYQDQPGGQFRFDRFYKQIAVAYGLGLRLNFGYFILRFDMGMKAINPAYETKNEHYAFAHPDFSRDFSFHFAVGLPF